MADRLTRRRDPKLAGLGLRVSAGAVILFLYFPLFIILLYAFTTEEASFGFPPPSLTFDWFGVAWRNPAIWRALRLSLLIALAAPFAALVLGSLGGAAV